MLEQIYKSTKNAGFHIFFKILGILLKIPSISNSGPEKSSIYGIGFLHIFEIRCALIEKSNFDQNTRYFESEILRN